MNVDVYNNVSKRDENIYLLNANVIFKRIRHLIFAAIYSIDGKYLKCIYKDKNIKNIRKAITKKKKKRLMMFFEINLT